MYLPRGKLTDYGDLIHEERWIVKGRHLDFAVHYGAEVATGPENRVPGSTTAVTPPERATITMDLHADKLRSRTATAVDEMGNPTVFDGLITYAVDDPALINLTDNGDGSCIVAAVGPTGVANLTFTATPTVGTPIVRVEAINIIAGNAAEFAFVDGAEAEVTPDPVV